VLAEQEQHHQSRDYLFITLAVAVEQAVLLTVAALVGMGVGATEPTAEITLLVEMEQQI
jgi:hypothetical protein